MLPVVEALAGVVRVSIDTRKAGVARAAVAAGATIINDVSATLWPVAAETGRRMGGHAHARRPLGHAAARPLRRRGRRGARPPGGAGAGWPSRPVSARCGSIPGSASARRPATTCCCSATSTCWSPPGFPVVIGTSRKSFLGTLAPQPDGTAAPPADRLEATVATTTWAIVHGADMVRVHDVAPAVQAAYLAGWPPRAQSPRAILPTPGSVAFPGRIPPMKGKWARGITPRFFAWIIKGHLAVSERPGGYARNHRKVRRHEEILWLRGRGLHPGRVVAPLPPQPARLRRDWA